MLAHSAVPAPDMELTPLEAFPWFAGSDPAAPAADNGGRVAGRDSRKLPVYAGVAVAFPALWGGASILAGGSLAEPAPAVQQAGLPNGIPSAGTLALTEAREVQTIAGIGQGATGAETISPAPQTLIVGQERNERPATAARVVTQTPPPAPRITSAPAEGQALAADTATVIATTLREFRSAMDESREAVRQVIRLGSRQRPARDALAEELTRYRLRQQNAAAARPKLNGVFDKKMVYQ